MQAESEKRALPAQTSVLEEWEVLGSNELEPGHKNQVYAFRQAIEEGYALNGAQVIDIDRHEHAIINESKPINVQMAVSIQERVERNNNRLWLSPEYSELMGAGLTKFSVVRTSVAETSAHQVFFGLLYNDKDTQAALPVAIKPCTTKPIKACYDWLNAQIVSTKEGMRCFKPVGFMYGSDGTGYSITELEKGVEALDNSNWVNVATDIENEEYAGQRQNIKFIAEKLANIHRKNIFHGDPQFKNIAVDITGDIFFIDWESATFLTDEAKPSIVLHKAVHDLRVMYGSMALPEQHNGIGLLSGFKLPVQWDYFKEYVFDPYMEAFIEGRDDNSKAFQQISDTEEQLKEYILSGRLYESFRRHRGPRTENAN